MKPQNNHSASGLCRVDDEFSCFNFSIGEDQSDFG